MPATLRIELFPSNLTTTVNFYKKVLRFTAIRHEKDYAYLQRDSIFIGCAGGSSEGSVPAKPEYRMPPTGIEAILEVDDLDAERDHVVSMGYPLQADIMLQAWRLRDFRVVDPDGYFLRITEKSVGKDGQGTE